MPSPSISMRRYRFDPEAPVIAIFGILQGTTETQVRRAKFALDTGATYTMIPWRIAKALGYEPEISRDRVDITTASGVERAPLVNLISFRALGVEVHGLEAIIHDLPAISRVDGLLGLNFLKNFKVILDFRQGLLELS